MSLLDRLFGVTEFLRNGTPLKQRNRINFKGSGFSAVDNPEDGTTDIIFDDAASFPEWEDGDYAAGAAVLHGGSAWVAPNGASEGQEPGVHEAWEALGSDTASSLNSVLAAQLASEGGTDGRTISLYGKSSALDGGGGQFVLLDAGGDTADNARFFASASGGKLWKRLYVGAVNVLWWGADPTGISDSSAAIQAALDTGEDVDFPRGTYLANNLTQSANNQTVSCPHGVAVIKKNANGDLFTSSGDFVTVRGISFRGDSLGEGGKPTYTGDNVVSSGTHFTMEHSDSWNAYGAAVRATGQKVRLGSPIYAYATAAEEGPDTYDIVIGQEGTATLYHELIGIRTHHNTGGIRLIDTGATQLIAGQFGKLTIEDGGEIGGGSGGDMVVGCRIHGDITIGKSNVVIVGNVLGTSSTTTFENGTGGGLWSFNSGGSNTPVVDSGNNRCFPSIAPGDATVRWIFGDSSSLAELAGNRSTGRFTFPAHMGIKNTYGIRFANSAGTDEDAGRLTMTAADVLSLANTAGFLQLSGASGVQFVSKTLAYSERVVASETQTQGQQTLSRDVTEVDTANTNDVVTLPAPQLGRMMIVHNAGPETLQIFPSTGHDLGAGNNTSTTLAAGSTAWFFGSSSTLWRRLL